MNITPSTRTITEYLFKLSAEDAAQALADPYSWVDTVVEQLRSAGAPAPSASNGNGHKARKPGKNHPLGFKAQTRRAKAARASEAGSRHKAGRPNGEKGGPSLEKVQCPHCPKQLARKFLPLHIASKHPDQPQPEPTASAV